MKRRIKRAFSTFMVVVLLLTAAPLSGFVGVEVPCFLDTSVRVEAATQYNLYWPVPTSSAAIGRISSAFGPRKSPTSGASTNHRGIDIPVSSGTSVYAAYDGVVVAIGKTNARGNYVLLYHASIGLSTLYQHLTCATVQKGDTVSGGSQIALSGNTGIGTGAHLHYGVMTGQATKVDNDQPSYGMAINPLGSNISYSSSSGQVISSDNPDDYTYPTRDLFYTSPVKTGSDVKWVQAVLWRLGYDISIDGSFGPATRDVVKQFQTDYGLDVDGSCGPATRSKLLEQWNKKKNGNISITLHAWLSNEEYGDIPDSYVCRDSLYLNYELIDSDTCQKINDLVDKTYATTLTFYTPSGQTVNSDPLQNRDVGCFKLDPTRAGTWKAKVVVTGDVNIEVNLSITVVYNASINSSVSSVSLNLNGTNSSTIAFSPAGGYPGAWGMSGNYDNTIVEISDSYESNGVMYAVLKGLKQGTTNLKITLFEKYSGNNEAVATITIPITVTANSYTISYNANGGSGAPTSQTKYYGTDITLSSTVPTRFGYTFLGWSTSSSATSATYLPGANFSGNSNTTLYAVWKAATTLSIGTTYSSDINFASKEIYYTFTPSSSGNFTFASTGSLDSQVYIYNSSGTVLANNDDISDSDRNFSLSYNLTGGTKYYVKVKAYSNKTGTTSFNITGKYTVSYHANGGSGVPSDQTKVHGTALTLSSTVPTRTGYIFLGWSTSSTATSATYQPGGSFTTNANTTLYAVWKENDTVLSSNSSNNATISTGGEKKYYTFTPSTSGAYVIYSTGSVDTKVYLYNSSGTELASNDDISSNDRNFRLQYNLVAGTSYRFAVGYYNSSTTGTIPFKFGRVYTVTYNANGGSGVPSSQTKDYGTALTLSSIKPTRIGYTFLGWSTSSTATSAAYTAGGTYSSESNATLYAVWKANTYSVKYNANGGSGTMLNSTHTYDVSKTLTSNAFTRSGYTFLGWSTSSTATSATYTNGQSVKNLTSVNGDTVNLYAVWKANSYGLFFEANGGTGAPANLLGASSYTISNTIPTKQGYTFIGWSTSSSATTATYVPGSVITLTSDTTLYAVWKANTYSVKYNANGGSGTMSNSSHTYGVSKSLTSNGFSRTGYTFLGWSTSSSATTATYTNAQSVKNLTSTDGATVNLYAVWSKIPTYTISYNANGGSNAPSSQTKTKDVTLTLSGTKPTRTGYTFLGWSTSSTATSATYQAGGSFTTNADTTLYAVWKANTYTVKYNANGGSGTMSNSSYTYDVSKALSLNTFTKDGYTFLGWSTSSSATTVTYTDGQSVKNLTSLNGDNFNLYAVWKASEATLSVNTTNNATISTAGEQKYYTFTPTESGTYVIYSTGSSDTRVYLYNSSGTELADDDDDGADRNFRLQYNLTAGTTYRFAVGYYSASNTGTIPFKFGKVYTVTYNANGGSSAPSSQTKDYGTALTLSSTMPTRSGYTFLGWSTSSTATRAMYQPGDSFTTEANTNMYAVWHTHTYSLVYSRSASCTSDGEKTYHCSVCSDTYTETIPATGHTWTAASCTAKKTCSVCDVTSGEPLGHSYTSKVTTAATCVNVGVETFTCSQCSHSYTESIAATGHSFGSWTTTTAATCTVEGRQTRACSSCSTIETKDVAALGHNYSTSYTVDKAATCETAGSKSQHCTRCTAKQNVTAIPATGHNYANGTCSGCGKTNVTTSATITVASASASVGNQVKVAISLKNNPGITSMLLSVNYDESKLQLVKVEDSGNLGTAVHSDVLSSPFTLSWANDTATSNYTYNGDIVVLTFNVKNGATLGETPITVTYEYNNYDIIDKDMNRVEFNVENGSVNIIDVLIGDVNNDGNVNTLDRVILTRYIAKWAEYPAESINLVAADVNCDGSVNTLDRVILTRYIAHWGGYESLPYNN